MAMTMGLTQAMYINPPNDDLTRFIASVYVYYGDATLIEPQLVNEASLGLVPDTWSSNQLAYQLAFRYGDFNAAAAIAVDLLVIGLLAAVLIVTRTGLFRREG